MAWSIGMVQFLVRIEAVNINVSIYDTEDLSTIRGGSFASLLLPGEVLNSLQIGPLKKCFPGLPNRLEFWMRQTIQRKPT